MGGWELVQPSSQLPLPWSRRPPPLYRHPTNFWTGSMEVSFLLFCRLLLRDKVRSLFPSPSHLIDDWADYSGWAEFNKMLNPLRSPLCSISKLPWCIKVLIIGNKRRVAPKWPNHLNLSQTTRRLINFGGILELILFLWDSSTKIVAWNRRSFSPIIDLVLCATIVHSIKILFKIAYAGTQVCVIPSMFVFSAVSAHPQFLIPIFLHYR